MNYPSVYRVYKTKKEMWSWFECAMCDAKFMEKFQKEEDMWDIDTCAKCNPEYQNYLKSKGYV